MKRGSQWEPLLFARWDIMFIDYRVSIDSQRTKLLVIVCLLVSWLTTRLHIVLIFCCLCLLYSKRSREYIILLTILFLTGSLESCGGVLMNSQCQLSIYGYVYHIALEYAQGNSVSTCSLVILPLNHSPSNLDSLNVMCKCFSTSLALTSTLQYAIKLTLYPQPVDKAAARFCGFLLMPIFESPYSLCIR